MKMKIYNKIYEPKGDDLTEEESEVRGKKCCIIPSNEQGSFDCVVEFEDGHTMPVYNCELREVERPIIYATGREIYIPVGDLASSVAVCNSEYIANNLVQKVQEHSVLKDTLELLMSEVIYQEDIKSTKIIDDNVRKKVNDLLNSLVPKAK